MNIDYPAQDQMEALRTLWKEAFGDTDAFLDNFYTHGFASDRCRCITLDGQVAAALYWFDGSLEGRPLAYLYAVATGKKYRGRGLCRALLENTHSHLKYLGYSGVLLMPGDADLSGMYEKMGYAPCTTIREFTCDAGEMAVSLEKLDILDYSRRRRAYLPVGGVVQAGDTLEFLHTMAEFYGGPDFLVAISTEDSCFAPELLGNAQAAPGILAALGVPQGRFRVPGEDMPFAMYHPLSDSPAPTYFGLAFD